MLLLRPLKKLSILPYVETRGQTGVLISYSPLNYLRQGLADLTRLAGHGHRNPLNPISWCWDCRCTWLHLAFYVRVGDDLRTKQLERSWGECVLHDTAAGSWKGY